MEETMFKILKTAFFSGFIALGSLAAAPSTAQADSFYLGIGGHGAGVHVQLGESGRSYRRHHRDRYDRWQRGPRGARQHYYRTCTPGRALYKASQMGIRHAYIRDVSHRYIRVGGHSYRGRIGITFARAPHCPVARWR
jgi:hypothetical protein